MTVHQSQGLDPEIGRHWEERKMKKFRRQMAVILSSMMVLSQGNVLFAQEDGGTGNEGIAMEDNLTQQGAGIGLQGLSNTGKDQENEMDHFLTMGVGTDLGDFSGDGETGAEEDKDVCVLDDLELSFEMPDNSVLMNAEDEYFYYVYPGGEQGIPDIIIGAFNRTSADGFYDDYTPYLTQARPDLTVAEGESDVTIGSKTLRKIVYAYTVSGYNVVDTRYVWPANNSLYMFAKREIPEISYSVGTALEDIIMSAQITGQQPADGTPQDQTDAPVPQDQTDAPVPQDQTDAPVPQTDAPAPQTDGGFCTKNEDSTWTVATDYYTITIPAAWTGHFEANIYRPSESGYSLQVLNTESRDAGVGGHIFSVLLIPENEDYTIYPSYDYLGTMSGPDGTFQVVILYPTDVQTTAPWSEIYDILYGDKNTALSSIVPVSGVTWTLPNGNTMTGDSGNTDAPAPQTETTPQSSPAPSTQSDMFGTVSGSTYTNPYFQTSFTVPAGWIFANDTQLSEFNGGLTKDRYMETLNAGGSVCAAYAQSSDGMQLLNLVLQDVSTIFDTSSGEITQDMIGMMFIQSSSYSSSSLENLGATVNSTDVTEVTFRGQAFRSLDISFSYMGMEGMQRQVGIPVGNYICLVTVRSIGSDTTLDMLNMFSAM